MGFRKGAWATCWAIEPKSDTNTTIRISIDRKDKQTGEYNQEFSGFVSFVGTYAASKARKLSVKDKIILGDVDVTTHYVKEKNITYTNFTCFNFEIPSEITKTNDDTQSEPQPEVDEGIVDDSGNIDSKKLPF